MGFFISLEGIDGSGKTTLSRVIAEHMKDAEIVSIREPGGTYISEKIRDLLLDSRNKGILPSTEAFLYAAARNQVVEEIIRPALAADKVVIADRYIDSTIAYQGYGRCLDREFLDKLNFLCTGGLKPDLTLLLDVDPVTCQRRKTGCYPDRLEKEGLLFQQRVRQGYLQIALEEPERIKIIDASQTAEEVAEQIMQLIDGLVIKR